jgi:hypothetical protein
MGVQLDFDHESCIDDSGIEDWGLIEECGLKSEDSVEDCRISRRVPAPIINPQLIANPQSSIFNLQSSLNPEVFNRQIFNHLVRVQSEPAKQP